MLLEKSEKTQRKLWRGYQNVSFVSIVINYISTSNDLFPNGDFDVFFARVALVDGVYFKAIEIEYKRKFLADLENEVTSCFTLKILTCIKQDNSSQ